MAKSRRLTKSNMGFGMPTDAPLYPKPPVFYKDMEGIFFTYETDEKAALELLPEELELKSSATVLLAFMKFTLSSFGPFKEVIQCISCTWHGEPRFYVAHIMVDGDAPMAWGREVYGEPKKLAYITFEKDQDIIMGTMERPKGNRICTGLIRPEKRIDRSNRKAGLGLIALKVIPNPEPGKEPSLVQLVEIHTNIVSSESWQGVGSAQYCSTSLIDPWHKLPVNRMINATYSICPYSEEIGKVVKEY